MKLKKITAIVLTLTSAALLFAGCAADANTSPSAGGEVPTVTTAATSESPSPSPSETTQAANTPVPSAIKPANKSESAKPSATAPQATASRDAVSAAPTASAMVPEVVPEAFQAAAATPAPTASETSTAAVKIDITSLSNKVQALSDKMDAATITDYKVLKKEGKQLESEIDRADDQAKLAYFNNTISREDFDRLDMQLDILDDLLDNAEDIMEARLGISD